MSEISSSLPFQVALYYNALYSVAYAAIEAAGLAYKLHYLEFNSQLKRMLVAPIFVIWCFGEAFRLYFGFVGNLKERVPHVAAFLIITAFPQLPCMIFLTFFQDFVLPFDLVGGVLIFVAQVLQLWLGYRALQGLINAQTSQFFRVAQQDRYRMG